MNLDWPALRLQYAAHKKTASALFGTLLEAFALSMDGWTAGDTYAMLVSVGGVLGVYTVRNIPPFDPRDV